jgi:hypothetical protein
MADKQTDVEDQHRQLSSEVADAEARIAALTADKRTLEAEHGDVAAELARLRELAAGHEQSAAEARQQLEETQATNAELREMLATVKRVFSAFGQQKIAMQSKYEALEAELATARDDLARSEQARAAAVADLEFQTALYAVPSLPGPTAEPGLSQSVSGPSGSTAEAPTGDPDDPWQPVRLASRYVLRDPLEIRINGEPGLLWDVSVSGCQVLVAARLRPNQAVRLVFPTQTAAIPCAGTVVWARLEPAAPGRPVRYRAGVHFVKPDEEALEGFVAQHAQLS